MCHEWHFDGGSTKKGTKVFRTGFYVRIGLNEIMNQYYLIEGIFRIIKDEEMKIG